MQYDKREQPQVQPPLPLNLPLSLNHRQQVEGSEDELCVPRSPKLMITSSTFMTQETQTSLKSEPYHPPADKLKMRKTRHQRASSYGSNATHSPRTSPMRERRISSGSPNRSQGSVADVEELIDNQTPFPKHLLYLQQDLNFTSPENLNTIQRESISSSNSSEEVCQIISSLNIDTLRN